MTHWQVVSSIYCFLTVQEIVLSETSNPSPSLAIPLPQRGIGINTHRHNEEGRISKKNSINWNNNNNMRTTTCQCNPKQRLSINKWINKAFHTKNAFLWLWGEQVYKWWSQSRRITWSSQFYLLKKGMGSVVWGAKLVNWWTMVGEVAVYHIVLWKFTMELPW